MRLAWLGLSLERARGLAAEPLKGYLDLGLDLGAIVKGYALVPLSPSVCHVG